MFMGCSVFFFMPFYILCLFFYSLVICLFLVDLLELLYVFCYWIFVYMCCNYLLVCSLSTLTIYYVKAYIYTDSLCPEGIRQKHLDRPTVQYRILSSVHLRESMYQGVCNPQLSLRSALPFHMLALERSSGSVYMDLIFAFGCKYLYNIFLAPVVMMGVVTHWVPFFWAGSVCSSSPYIPHCLEVLKKDCCQRRLNAFPFRLGLAQFVFPSFHKYLSAHCGHRNRYSDLIGFVYCDLTVFISN